MIVFNIGDYGNFRPQTKKHMVIFIRFDDEVIAVSGTADCRPRRESYRQELRIGSHGPFQTESGQSWPWLSFCHACRPQQCQPVPAIK